ncbi:hypothetical protein GPALN_012760 [Globodera pallida]|nr:hypothetical protein GPALN_012760 [Globodera pallida]
MALSLAYLHPCPLILLFIVVLCPPSGVVSVPLMASDYSHLLRDHSSTQNIQRTKTALNGSETAAATPAALSSSAILSAAAAEGDAPTPPSSNSLPVTASTTSTPTPTPTLPPASSNSSAPSDASARLLCQFFIFSTLFGSVCTVSACTCLFHTRRSIVGSSQQRRAASADDLSISRLARIREPFGPNKPFCLKFDEKGLCYASPLTREVPPLPTYEDACKMLSFAELVANCAADAQKAQSGDETKGRGPPATTTTDGGRV